MSKLSETNTEIFNFFYWIVPEVIADFFIQIEHIFLNTRNEL